MKTIPIFFTFDDQYTIPAAVAFNTLLKKAPEDVFYKLYVLNNGLTQENEEILSEVVSSYPNSSLEFRNAKGFLQEAWEDGSFFGHQKHQQFTMETLYRCFAAKFFPEYDKIIYSDVDIVIMDDISELFDINLDDKYIGAVKGCFNQFHYEQQFGYMKPEYAEKFKDTYFAGGIWLLNLKKIRDDNLENKMIEIICDDSIVKASNDQDIMNFACDNNVEYISLRYISYPYLESSISKMKEPFKTSYSNFEIWESIYYPKILHYAARKPWNGKARKSEVWFAALDELPIKNKYEWVNHLKKERQKKKFLTTIITLFIPIKSLRDKMLKNIRGAKREYDE